MKISRIFCQTLLLCMMLTSCGDTFRFTPTTVISVENDGQKAAADWFAWLFAKAGGFVPQVEVDAFGADVVLREDSSLDAAAYRIKVTGRRTCIEASSPLGFFYAFQYIRQLLPSAINASRHADLVEWSIPVMSVSDSPSAEYSGLVLDLCCCFLPKDNVLHLIECMPDMGVYDLILVNDDCYTQEELEEMHGCAGRHNVKVISEHLMDLPVTDNHSYELVWQDDFNEIDERYWSRISRGRPDWRNYMSYSDSLFAVRDGCLILRALENDGVDPSDTASFLTGGIYTKDKFTMEYGKVEVRAKLPSAKSVWPAIWMMPQKESWPDGGEIDIMEHLNYDGFIYQTVHSRYVTTLGIRDPKPYATTKVDYRRYNIYGVEILPDSLVFSVNGRKTMSYPRLKSGEYSGATQYPFGKPYYILIDMQIGGSWVGPATAEDLPAEMKVDWIKVYSYK